MFQKLPLFAAAVLLAASASAQVVNVSSQIVVFTYTFGATSAPSPQLDSITGPIGTNINLTSVGVNYGGGAPNWLLVSPTAGALPMAISLQVTNLNLAVGTYSAVLQPAFSTSIDPSSLTQITVFLVVTQPGPANTASPGPPAIAFSPSSLSFFYQAGSAQPVPQSLSVITSDNSPFNATWFTIDGNPWLSVFPSSGASPGTPIVSVNPAGLPSGVYTGNISFRSATGAAGLVTVSFSITAATLSTSPSALTFNAPSNFGLSAYQPIKVSAAVATTFSASTNDGGVNWLQTDTGTAKTPATVNVRVNTSSLAPGQYQGIVTLQADPTDAVTIPITLNVGLPAALTLTPSTLNFSYVTGSAAPSGQTVAITSATSAPNQNVSIAFSTTAGGNWLSTSVSAATTPANLTVGVNPAGLPAGSYVGYVSITPAGQGASPQTVTVNLTITGAGYPVVSAVVNGASYAPPPAPVSPGEIVALFGSGLGPKTLATYALTANGAIPTTLAQTQVTFDGIPAPILYASDGQTGVQVPYGINPTVTNLSVRYQGVPPAAPVTLPVASAAPGIFTVQPFEAAAVNQNGTLNSAANPAARGSIISIFATGEGQTNPKSVEGAVTPINGPFPVPAQPVAVQIGGQGTQIPFLGEAPASITGILQLNVQVPTTIPSGANSIVIEVGSVSSPAGVTVFIR